MSITILNPGLLTTVQDFGRIGYQQFGVPVSGVVDPRAMSIANILVDNPEDEAVLECTMLGPQIRFNAPNAIAITGGDLGPTIDNQPIPNYAAIRVEAGQVLRFAGLRSGCRAYIAFAGGLDIAPVMGSRSTYMKAKIGGVEGRKLQKDDVIKFRKPNPDLRGLNIRHISPEFVPRLEYKLRVVLGPQDDMFTEHGIETFLSESYVVTPEFDRMGCRLDGEIIEHKGESGDIISDGIAFGAIQVPTAGKPIIMLSDRQTTGGYTKIANVISADFRILAQLKAGDRVRFAQVSVAAAQDALLTQRAALKTLRTAVSRA
ncbi:MAG: biotin-dependent carboxyltransferase family protein [Oscillospiraceae bacterium]|nr:biotin-dependent carboxyltransferase family protein [Oscillospiraceae bacterium]MDD5981646.1 biotin-dependent carboxyltransferase family protein [Clostridium sp.]MDD7537526.1 biotin-dependent carboxyltransferase family protein [Oscillospiraceae bacterium]MDY5736065.1 biotin-dependent carboxyltransferase family protein [Oscillospiraceae bacterium]MDY6020548.1 biotin-dependent carboxyltransferase family protein [Oscillospiraceae bacterium]